ncbi:MAG: hypothetical protein KBT87_02670 [Gammaproteobacteria bacterium]|nr:hypothetical protein [Gammaproteobacteria bacterium]MBQ0773554.1 hypothetical protein [Gammaproteobacteria bacterium]
MHLFRSAMPYLFALIAGLSQASHAQVLQIQGSDLPGLLGQPSAIYTLFAVKDGHLDPIPHQWLEYSNEGFPYFKSDDSTTAAGDRNRIDASDLLLLRKEDAGDKLTTVPTEQVTGEITIALPEGPRYAYVVKNAYRQATQRYVKFDQSKMVIKSTDYALYFDSKNMLIWNDFFYRGYIGPSGQRESILDTLKIRLSAGLFRENSRITLSNDNLDPKIEEIIEGPLAWQIYATTTLSVARIPVLKIRNYFLVMPQQTDIYARFTLPTIAKTVLQRPSVSISLDGNQLYGGKLITSWTKDLVAITDGKMSQNEKDMVGTPMSGKNWLWFGTGRGFDLLAQLDFRQGFEAPARLFYQDDSVLANPPERFPGQLPNVGFSIDEIPIGKEFNFLTKLFFSADSDKLAPGTYAENTLRDNKISYRQL